MKDYKLFMEERCVAIGRYIKENSCTVRQAAEKFKVGKSTVHKDVSERLWDVDMTLAKEVEKVLMKNKAERHIRGGMSTREIFRKKRGC